MPNQPVNVTFWLDPKVKAEADALFSEMGPSTPRSACLCGSQSGTAVFRSVRPWLRQKTLKLR